MLHLSRVGIVDVHWTYAFSRHVERVHHGIFYTDVAIHYDTKHRSAPLCDDPCAVELARAARGYSRWCSHIRSQQEAASRLPGIHHDAY